LAKANKTYSILSLQLKLEAMDDGAMDDGGI